MLDLPVCDNDVQATSSISITDLQSGWNYLAAIVESSEDAIVTKNLNGIITTWNGAAERIFGYSATEAVGKPITILIPEDRQAEEPQILARIRAGERVEHFETIRRRKNGSLINVSETISPVRDQSGIIIGASKIARDITELVAARAALAQSNEHLDRLVHDRTASLEQAVSQMEEFTYTVSHDLRAPLRSVKGFANLALVEFGDGMAPGLRNYLERIATSADRMEALIRDILDYAKLDRESRILKPVSLEALLSRLLNEHAEMRPPKAEVELRRPLDSVVAHERLLSQAVTNLLTNAVKFVPAGSVPRVEIWTERRRDFVRLWVKDNGIGIHPKYHDQIFGIFERLHRGEYEGSGVGLAIVRKAAENMGGTVGLVSDGISGSSFWLELPGAQP